MKFLLLFVVSKLFGRKNHLALLLSNPGAEIHSYNIVKLYAPIHMWVEFVIQ